MLIHQPNITGSLLVNGEESGGTGFPFSGSAIITGSLEVSGSTISGSFVGDGSGIQNVEYNNLTNIPTDFSGSFTGSIQADSLTIPVGSTAERPTNPSTGEIRFNTDGIGIEVYNGIEWKLIGGGITREISLESVELTTTSYNAATNALLEVEYLVVAGGGGGASTRGGGGGAGGYRSSVSGENSGGGASAESPLSILFNTSYTVTVGAGGNGAAYPAGAGVSGNGSDSVFSTITSIGGGAGERSVVAGRDGGSGGGAGNTNSGVIPGGSGTVGQGYAGGQSDGSPNNTTGGGGGASQVGANNDGGSTGGNGVSSSITGSSIYRGGGGGGSVSSGNTSGGLGGGGTGSSSTATAGTVNTGGGGGGGYDVASASGGSGVVILRYPSSFSITVGAGLTASTTTVGANKVTTFTEGTDTISFS